MEIGVLMFPSPFGSADMARNAEQMGFSSLVFADTQCLTPEVWSQLMLVAAAGAHRDRNRGDEPGEPRPLGYLVSRAIGGGRTRGEALSRVVQSHRMDQQEWRPRHGNCPIAAFPLDRSAGNSSAMLRLESGRAP
jgi:hypothetical protein